MYFLEPFGSAKTRSEKKHQGNLLYWNGYVFCRPCSGPLFQIRQFFIFWKLLQTLQSTFDLAPSFFLYSVWQFYKIEQLETWRQVFSCTTSEKWKQTKKNNTNNLGAKFSSCERHKKSNINSPIILRNELKAYIQKVFFDIFYKSQLSLRLPGI